MADSNAPTTRTPQQAVETLRSWNSAPQSYEVDQRWLAVDEYTMSHLHPSGSVPRGEHLSFALSNSAQQNLPSIAVSAAQGKFLMLQARMLGAAQVLEVGTLGAYSTIWLAAANSRVRVTTVEVDEHHVRVSRENLKHAGVDDRVQVELGAGLDVLPRLRDEVQRGERPPFDFVFIDADKGNSWAYFDLSVQMCRPGACIVVDNVVRKGNLVNPEMVKANNKEVLGSRRAVENVGKDPRVDGVVLQTVGEKNYDGFLIAVVGEP